MNKNRDEKLDNLLRSRRVESVSPDLAQRIILQAQQLPQNKTLSIELNGFAEGGDRDAKRLRVSLRASCE